MPQAARKRFPHCWQASATEAPRLALIALALLSLCVPRLTGQVQPITNIVATSAANFEPGLPPPGSLGAIFCLGLKDIQGTIAANTVPLPRELAGVHVTIGGAPAPLLSVSAVNGYFQINFQTPQETQTLGPAAPAWVEVRIEQLSALDRQRVAEGTATLRLRQKPGEFFMLTFGEPHQVYSVGQPAVLRASDFSLITPANPARPKDILVAFATGLGPTEPVVPTGVPAPFSPLAIVKRIEGYMGFTAEGTLVRINGLDRVPLYVGLAPGLIGVYQVNFQLSGNEMAYDGAFYLDLHRIECIGADAPGVAIRPCRPSPSTSWVSKVVLVPYKPD